MTDYRDLQVLPPLRYPELVFADKNTAIVSDCSGHCRTVQLDSGRVATSPSFMISISGGQLSSLRTDPSNQDRCAVATGSGWGGLWQLGSTKIERIYPETAEGPVSAIGFSGTGSLLALGVGVYPLNPARESAACVEILVIDGEPLHLACVAVPGVCVDWLAWNATKSRWIVLSGRRSQKGGYLTQLDGENLRSVQITELDCWMMSYCHLLERTNAILIGREGTLTLRRLDSPRIPCWQWSSKANQYRVKIRGIALPPIRTCVDTDRNVIFTNCGELVDLDSGNVVDQLPVPEGCQAVATRPGSGFVAVAASGMMRIYEPT